MRSWEARPPLESVPSVHVRLEWTCASRKVQLPGSKLRDYRRQPRPQRRNTSEAPDATCWDLRSQLPLQECGGGADLVPQETAGLLPLDEESPEAVRLRAELRKAEQRRETQRKFAEAKLEREARGWALERDVLRREVQTALKEAEGCSLERDALRWRKAGSEAEKKQRILALRSEVASLDAAALVSSAVARFLEEESLAAKTAAGIPTAESEYSETAVAKATKLQATVEELHAQLPRQREGAIAAEEAAAVQEMLATTSSSVGEFKSVEDDRLQRSEAAAALRAAAERAVAARRLGEALAAEAARRAAERDAQRRRRRFAAVEEAPDASARPAEGSAGVAEIVAPTSLANARAALEEARMLLRAHREAKVIAAGGQPRASEVVTASVPPAEASGEKVLCDDHRAHEAELQRLAEVEFAEAKREGVAGFVGHIAVTTVFASAGEDQDRMYVAEEAIPSVHLPPTSTNGMASFGSGSHRSDSQLHLMNVSGQVASEAASAATAAAAVNGTTSNQGASCEGSVWITARSTDTLVRDLIQRATLLEASSADALRKCATKDAEVMRREGPRSGSSFMAADGERARPIAEEVLVLEPSSTPADASRASAMHFINLEQTERLMEDKSREHERKTDISLLRAKISDDLSLAVDVGLQQRMEQEDADAIRDAAADAIPFAGRGLEPGETGAARGEKGVWFSSSDGEGLAPGGLIISALTSRGQGCLDEENGGADFTVVEDGRVVVPRGAKLFKMGTAVKEQSVASFISGGEASASDSLIASALSLAEAAAQGAEQKCNQVEAASSGACLTSCDSGGNGVALDRLIDSVLSQAVLASHRSEDTRLADAEQRAAVDSRGMILGNMGSAANESSVASFVSGGEAFASDSLMAAAALFAEAAAQGAEQTCQDEAANPADSLASFDCEGFCVTQDRLINEVLLPADLVHLLLCDTGLADDAAMQRSSKQAAAGVIAFEVDADTTLSHFSLKAPSADFERSSDEQRGQRGLEDDPLLTLFVEEPDINLPIDGVHVDSYMMPSACEVDGFGKYIVVSPVLSGALLGAQLANDLESAHVTSLPCQSGARSMEVKRDATARLSMLPPLMPTYGSPKGSFRNGSKTELLDDGVCECAEVLSIDRDIDSREVVERHELNDDALAWTVASSDCACLVYPVITPPIAESTQRPPTRGKGVGASSCGNEQSQKSYASSIEQPPPKFLDMFGSSGADPLRASDVLGQYGLRDSRTLAAKAKVIAAGGQPRASEMSSDSKAAILARNVVTATVPPAEASVEEVLCDDHRAHEAELQRLAEVEFAEAKREDLAGFVGHIAVTTVFASAGEDQDRVYVAEEAIPSVHLPPTSTNSMASIGSGSHRSDSQLHSMNALGQAASEAALAATAAAAVNETTSNQGASCEGSVRITACFTDTLVKDMVQGATLLEACSADALRKCATKDAEVMRGEGPRSGSSCRAADGERARPIAEAVLVLEPSSTPADASRASSEHVINLEQARHLMEDKSREHERKTNISLLTAEISDDLSSAVDVGLQQRMEQGDADASRDAAADAVPFAGRGVKPGETGAARGEEGVWFSSSDGEGLASGGLIISVLTSRGQGCLDEENGGAHFTVVEDGRVVVARGAKLLKMGTAVKEQSVASFISGGEASSSDSLIASARSLAEAAAQGAEQKCNQVEAASSGDCVTSCDSGGNGAALDRLIDSVLSQAVLASHRSEDTRLANADQRAAFDSRGMILRNMGSAAKESSVASFVSGGEASASDSLMAAAAFFAEAAAQGAEQTCQDEAANPADSLPSCDCEGFCVTQDRLINAVLLPVDLVHLLSGDTGLADDAVMQRSSKQAAARVVAFEADADMTLSHSSLKAPSGDVATSSDEQSGQRRVLNDPLLTLLVEEPDITLPIDGVHAQLANGLESAHLTSLPCQSGARSMEVNRDAAARLSMLPPLMPPYGSPTGSFRNGSKTALLDEGVCECADVLVLDRDIDSGDVVERHGLNDDALAWTVASSDHACLDYPVITPPIVESTQRPPTRGKRVGASSFGNEQSQRSFASIIEQPPPELLDMFGSSGGDPLRASDVLGQHELRDSRTLVAKVAEQASSLSCAIGCNGGALSSAHPSRHLFPLWVGATLQAHDDENSVVSCDSPFQGLVLSPRLQPTRSELCYSVSPDVFYEEPRTPPPLEQTTRLERCRRKCERAEAVEEGRSWPQRQGFARGDDDDEITASDLVSPFSALPEAFTDRPSPMELPQRPDLSWASEILSASSLESGPHAQVNEGRSLQVARTTMRARSESPLHAKDRPESVKLQIHSEFDDSLMSFMAAGAADFRDVAMEVLDVLTPYDRSPTADGSVRVSAFVEELVEPLARDAGDRTQWRHLESLSSAGSQRNRDFAANLLEHAIRELPWQRKDIVDACSARSESSAEAPSYSSVEPEVEASLLESIGGGACSLDKLDVSRPDSLPPLPARRTGSFGSVSDASCGSSSLFRRARRAFTLHSAAPVAVEAQSDQVCEGSGLADTLSSMLLPAAVKAVSAMSREARVKVFVAVSLVPNVGFVRLSDVPVAEETLVPITKEQAAELESIVKIMNVARVRSQTSAAAQKNLAALAGVGANAANAAKALVALDPLDRVAVFVELDDEFRNDVLAELFESADEEEGISMEQLRAWNSLVPALEVQTASALAASRLALKVLAINPARDAAEKLMLCSQADRAAALALIGNNFTERALALLAEIALVDKEVALPERNAVPLMSEVEAAARSRVAGLEHAAVDSIAATIRLMNAADGAATLAVFDSRKRAAVLEYLQTSQSESKKDSLISACAASISTSTLGNAATSLATMGVADRAGVLVSLASEERDLLIEILSAKPSLVATAGAALCLAGIDGNNRNVPLTYHPIQDTLNKAPCLVPDGDSSSPLSHSFSDSVDLPRIDRVTIDGFRRAPADAQSLPRRVGASGCIPLGEVTALSSDAERFSSTALLRSLQRLVYILSAGSASDATVTSERRHMAFVFAKWLLHHYGGVVDEVSPYRRCLLELEGQLQSAGVLTELTLSSHTAGVSSALGTSLRVASSSSSSSTGAQLPRLAASRTAQQDGRRPAAFGKRSLAKDAATLASLPEAERLALPRDSSGTNALAAARRSAFSQVAHRSGQRPPTVDIDDALPEALVWRQSLGRLLDLMEAFGGADETSGCATAASSNCFITLPRLRPLSASATMRGYSAQQHVVAPSDPPPRNLRPRPQTAQPALWSFSTIS